MKGLRSVVVGSAVGGLLGAAAFFAVDGLIPKPANAQTVDLGVNIVSLPIYTAKSIYLSSSPLLADKSVYVMGECSSSGSKNIYLNSMPHLAEESWYPASSPFLADMNICLTGNIQEWFKKVN